MEESQHKGSKDEFNRQHGLPKDLRVKGIIQIGEKHLPEDPAKLGVNASTIKRKITLALLLLLFAAGAAQARVNMSCGISPTTYSTAGSFTNAVFDNAYVFTCQTNYNISSIVIGNSSIVTPVSMVQTITGNLTWYTVNLTLRATPGYHDACDQTNITFIAKNASGNTFNSTTINVYTYPCVGTNGTMAVVTLLTNSTFMITPAANHSVAGMYYLLQNISLQKKTNINSTAIWVWWTENWNQTVSGPYNQSVTVLLTQYNATDAYTNLRINYQDNGSMVIEAELPLGPQVLPLDVKPGAIIAGIIVIGISASYGYARYKRGTSTPK